MQARLIPRRFLHVLSLVLAAILAGCGGGPARNGAQGSASTQSQRPAASASTSAQRLSHLPSGWIKRLQNLSPAEQAKFLANSARFRNLPPDRRAEIRSRLEKWNKLTAQQRQAVLERQRVWSQLTPGQQSYIRKTLLPIWRSLSATRRQVLLQKLHALRNLDSAHRAAKLNDDSFTAGLSPDEMKMLRDLSNLTVIAPASSQN